MYEQFKNQFTLALATTYSTKDIEVILNQLDIVAYNYDISQKETSVMVYNSDIPEIVKIYLVSKKVEGLSEQTLYNYGNALRKFFFELQKAPDKISSNDIRVYLYRYQQANGTSNRSLDKIRQMICGFFNWATCEGYLEKNPALTIKPIKYESEERKPLTQIELEYIRQACVTPRDKAMVEFLYSTGCRVSELAIVKLSDINWNNKSVHLFGKGKKHRFSYLNAKAEVALLEYLKTRHDGNDYLFVSERNPHGKLSKCGIEKIIRQIAERASTHVKKPVSPHIFRHTTATTALNNGMPIEDIQIILGHENISTTMIYAKTSTENVRNGHMRYIV